MTTTAILKCLAAVSVCGATAAAVQGDGSTAQDWSVLGLLAAVVLGIGARLVGATDRNTTKLGEFTTQIQLLTKQLTDARADERRALERMASDIKDIPKSVTDAIGRRDSA